ncbi:CpaD family pilus assembly lipoprotein [Terrihabitans sp. B22-R8]|uniref:CpaD family pilus assembly lipoprotein n=1 Tax=Terrihabitans sp. B22-R8 TaxID=3425128 RepID=UPI00403C17C3
MILRRLAAVVVACAALGGCNTTRPPVYLEPASQAVLVKPEDNVLLLKGSSRGYLTATERLQLTDFIAIASRGRRDAVHLSITGTRSALQEEVRLAAIKMGVPPYNIRLFDDRADPHGLFRVRVNAVMYNAVVPLCPANSIIGPSVNDNSFDPSLGCSTRHNLAMAVSDPSDLIDNSAVVASNAERAAVPVARYRTFGSGGNAAGERATAAVSGEAAGVATP